MTTPATGFGIAPAAPEGLQAVPDQADEPPARQCARCGGVGTHYLTCPALRLPPGYRLARDPRGERQRP